MCTISSNTLSLYHFLTKLGILHYLGFFKHLTEIHSDSIDTYHELEVYIVVKDYKNNVEHLKEQRDLEVLRELEINEIKEEAKIQLNELEIGKKEVLDNLKFELEYGSLRNRYINRSNSYEDEIKLRIEAKVRINEINRLKEEVRNNEDILLNSDTKIDGLLTDLKYEEKDIMNDIMTSEEKGRKLRISSSYIIGIKHLILSA